MAAYQNKKTGEVVSVQLFLSDLNDVHYDTDVLAAVGSPTALGFTIHVHQDNALSGGRAQTNSLLWAQYALATLFTYPNKTPQPKVGEEKVPGTLFF